MMKSKGQKSLNVTDPSDAEKAFDPCLPFLIQKLSSNIDKWICS